jgi:hypothetical protein
MSLICYRGSVLLQGASREDANPPEKASPHWTGGLAVRAVGCPCSCRPQKVGIEDRSSVTNIPVT